RWISSRQNQLARQRERALIGPLKHEGTGISHQRCVQAGGNLGGKLHSRFTSQTKNHLGGRRSMKNNTVDMRERTAADMVIDADQEMTFQAFEPRAVDAVTLENNGGLVAAGDAVSLHDLIGKWKRAVDARNAVVQHDIGVLAHGAQTLAASQRGTDRVAVRAGVRGQHEALVLPDLPKHILQHLVTSPPPHPWGPCLASGRVAAVVPHEPWPAPRGRAGSTTRERAVSAAAPPVHGGYTPAPLPVRRDFDPPLSHLLRR